MKYWLMKSEGDCYSIDNLKKDKKTAWEGVRNYQARNYMVRDMALGDMVLFYHSNGTATAPTGVYGLATVSKLAHKDMTQFNPVNEHYDPKATKANPIWQCVDISFVKKFDFPITLTEIKIDPKLEGMVVRENGSRLSIQPVSEKHYKHILELTK